MVNRAINRRPLHNGLPAGRVRGRRPSPAPRRLEVLGGLPRPQWGRTRGASRAEGRPAEGRPPLGQAASGGRIWLCRAAQYAACLRLRRRQQPPAAADGAAGPGAPSGAGRGGGTTLRAHIAVPNAATLMVHVHPPRPPARPGKQPQKQPTPVAVRPGGNSSMHAGENSHSAPPLLRPRSRACATPPSDSQVDQPPLAQASGRLPKTPRASPSAAPPWPPPLTHTHASGPRHPPHVTRRPSRGTPAPRRRPPSPSRRSPARPA
jgi:hypothetical protein